MGPIAQHLLRQERLQLVRTAHIRECDQGLVDVPREDEADRRGLGFGAVTEIDIEARLVTPGDDEIEITIAIDVNAFSTFSKQ